MKKILVISHHAERTGAPILLLHLASLIRKDVQVFFLVVHDGVLTAEFDRIGDTTVLYKRSSHLIQRIFNKIRSVLVLKRLSREVTTFDVIISNTITNGHLHPILKKHPRVFTYVHELTSVIRSFTTENELGKVISHTHSFLYPSLAVKKVLTQLTGNKKPLLHLPYHIPDHLHLRNTLRQQMRNILKISEEDMIVGGMGTLSQRKGIDIFLNTALVTHKRLPGVRFLWCGGDTGEREWQMATTFIMTHNLGNVVSLIPARSESWKIMACFDLFFLSSREDAYPLVSVEAAMMQVPVIYFKHTGGAEEFFGNNGFGVGELSEDAACEAILKLANSEEMRTTLALQGRERYVALHNAQVIQQKIDSLF